MGKLKKKTKASRARRLQMMEPLGGAGAPATAAASTAAADDDETPFTLPVVDEGKKPQTSTRAAGQTELLGPKKVSSSTGETQGAMKARQAKEWKRVRNEIEQLRQQRRKIRKSDPEGAKQRKQLADRIKWLQVQYQQRVQSERATLQEVEYPTVKEARKAEQEAERREDETRALRSELDAVKKQMEQMQSRIAALKQQQQQPPQPPQK